MRKRNGQWHKFFCFAAGVAEHHALVACAEAVAYVFGVPFNAHCNVGTLAVNGNVYTAFIECERTVFIADFFYCFACDCFVIDFGKGCDFAHNKQSVVGGATLYGATRILVF